MILYDVMKQYADRKAKSFHTPGHKGNLSELDITELDIDGVGSTGALIEQAEAYTAEYYGASYTHYLVGGTTSGVLALISSVSKSRLIVGRASHKSIFNGCILSDVEPIIIENEIADDISLPLSPEQIEHAVKANPDAVGAFITTPNYFGMTADIKNIRAVMGDKLLLVDSAHGAHCGAHKMLPKNATKDCDACVLSAHKTLPALTQAAYLNVNNEALERAVLQTLNLSRTTSPSYLLMASLEYATDYLVKHSDKYKTLIDAVNKYIPERVKNDDGTRIVIDLKDYHISGYTADYYLQSQGIFCEFGNPRYIVFIVTVVDEVEDVVALAAALKRLRAAAPTLPRYNAESEPTIRTARAISFTEASKQEVEYVSLSTALNRISAVEAGLFPPCLPIIARGEIVTQEIIDLLSRANVFGIKDGNILVIK